MLGVLGLAIAGLLTCPRAACATSITLEDQAPSEAQMHEKAVRGATSIEVGDASFAVYGTLAHGEVLDAYQFVVPDSVEATVTLLVKDGMWLGFAPPNLLLQTADGYELGPARPRERRESQFDWRSLERIRRESEVHASFAGGRPYVVAVQWGTATGLTLPYVLLFDRGTETVTEGGRAEEVSAVAQLWLGLYGQRHLRFAPLFGLVVLAAVFLALLMWTARSIGRVLHRLLRTRQAPATSEHSQDASPAPKPHTAREPVSEAPVKPPPVVTQTAEAELVPDPTTRDTPHASGERDSAAAASVGVEPAETGGASDGDVSTGAHGGRLDRFMARTRDRRQRRAEVSSAEGPVVVEDRIRAYVDRADKATDDAGEESAD